jgi:hypothetical protein
VGRTPCPPGPASPAASPTPGCAGARRSAWNASTRTLARSTPSGSSASFGAPSTGSAQGRLLPQPGLGTVPAGRPPAVPGRPARPPGPRPAAEPVRLRDPARRHRPLRVSGPGRRPLPAQQLCPACVPPRLRRAVRTGTHPPGTAGHRRDHHLARLPSPGGHPPSRAPRTTSHRAGEASRPSRRAPRSPAGSR